MLYSVSKNIFFCQIWVLFYMLGCQKLVYFNFFFTFLPLNLTSTEKGCHFLES